MFYLGSGRGGGAAPGARLGLASWGAREERRLVPVSRVAGLAGNITSVLGLLAVRARAFFAAALLPVLLDPLAVLLLLLVVPLLVVLARPAGAVGVATLAAGVEAVGDYAGLLVATGEDAVAVLSYLFAVLPH